MSAHVRDGAFPIAFVLLAGIVGACANQPQSGNAKIMDRTVIDQVQPGADRAAVRTLLGSPNTESIEKDRVIWTYWFSSADGSNVQAIGTAGSVASTLVSMIPGAGLATLGASTASSAATSQGKVTTQTTAFTAYFNPDDGRLFDCSLNATSSTSGSLGADVAKPADTSEPPKCSREYRQRQTALAQPTPMQIFPDKGVRIVPARAFRQYGKVNVVYETRGCVAGDVIVTTEDGAGRPGVSVDTGRTPQGLCRETLTIDPPAQGVLVLARGREHVTVR